MTPPTHDALFRLLLEHPPGTYALSSFGQTKAIILTGSPAFHRAAYTLFTNGGGAAQRSVFAETPLPPLHRTDRPEVVWFCLPETRAQMALALWFWGQLLPHHSRDVVDKEGDFVEVVCDHEVELWTECEQLACDFMVSHMRADYRALPSYESDDYLPTEHGLGHPGAAHTSEDA